jgi:hypothetical protein
LELELNKSERENKILQNSSSTGDYNKFLNQTPEIEISKS